MTDMSRTLVIGFGNPDRQDDGVAFELVNHLRSWLGQPPLPETETGLERLGNPVDAVFILQLGPELLEVARAYGRLIFVDAHVQPEYDAVHCTPVEPEYAPATFTHHMTPALFLALLQALFHHYPEAHVVSIRGYSFDFERCLSAPTAALVQPALDRVVSLLDGTESRPAAGER
jgi:hydrogenase maturation protease